MVKLHQRKFISADPEKCVGCQVCEYACSMTKEKAFNPVKSRIRVVRENQIHNIAVTCRFCENPACVAACPRNALSQSTTSGNIVVDKDKCICYIYPGSKIFERRRVWYIKSRCLFKTRCMSAPGARGNLPL